MITRELGNLCSQIVSRNRLLTCVAASIYLSNQGEREREREEKASKTKGRSCFVLLNLCS